MEVVDCFNVCLNVPCIKTPKEAAYVLQYFNNSQNEINKIAKELFESEDLASSGGIPIKNMVLSIELAL